MPSSSGPYGGMNAASVGAEAGGFVELTEGIAVGARVDVRPMALAQDTVLTVNDVVDIPSSETVDFMPAGPAVQFGPSGTMFSAPADVMLPLYPNTLTMDFLSVIHRDDVTQELTWLTPYLVTPTTVYANTTSFSSFQPGWLSPVAVREFLAQPAEVPHEGSTTLRWVATNATSCVMGTAYCVDNPGSCSPAAAAVPVRGTMPLVPNEMAWGGARLALEMKFKCEGPGGSASHVAVIKAQPQASLQVVYDNMAYTDEVTVPVGARMQVQGPCFSRTDYQPATVTWNVQGIPPPAANANYWDATFPMAGDFNVAMTCTNSIGTAVSFSMVIHVRGITALPLNAPCVLDNPYEKCDASARLLCLNGTCTDHCTDVMQDVDEVGLDCGGSCSSCGTLLGGRFQDHPTGYVLLTDDFCFSATEPIDHRIFARQDISGTMTWSAAQAACEALPPHPAGPWHLPTAEEWAGNNWQPEYIQDRVLNGGVMDFTQGDMKTALPGIVAGTYWTNTPYFENQPVVVDFSTAKAAIVLASQMHRVRCVAWSDPPARCR